MLQLTTRFSFILLAFLIILVISGLVSTDMSLLLGIAYAVIFGNPFQLKTQWSSGLILKTSIVVMGFGLNINEIWDVAQSSFLITIVTITFALICGLLLGKLLKVNNKLSFLIAGGTAICGGSAIAALAPTIQAKPVHLLISISVVFILNGVGLLIYPELAIHLGLTEQEFGLWAALGIHDTSSVVGAAATFGDQSLKIATTTKLARALWIIPLVFIASLWFNSDRKSASFPLFILFFIVASIATSFIPILDDVSNLAPTVAKRGMAVSLLLIGAGFTKETLKEIRLTALWQGIILWILVSVGSLWLIKVL